MHVLIFIQKSQIWALNLTTKMIVRKNSSREICNEKGKRCTCIYILVHDKEMQAMRLIQMLEERGGARRSASKEN